MSAAAAALGALGVVDEELAATVALALRKRQEVTLEGAAARAVAKRRAERRAADARALLPPDASEPARRFVVARFVHSKAPIAAEAVRARCEEYQNIAATVAHRAGLAAEDRSGPKGPPVDAEALAAAALERVAKLATAEVPALSVDGAVADALAAADAAAVSNHIGDAVRRALEPKPGGWIFAAARGEPRLGAAARKALVEALLAAACGLARRSSPTSDDWPAWTRSVDKAADEEAGRWAKAEALALYALDEALREAGLDDQPDLAETLVREAFFRGHREPETLVADVQARAAALVAERKQEGESCERRLARVALALKEACDARNLRPSLIAADALRKKILTAWRNGQDLQEAAAAAARQYENSDRNDAVPQTVWDPPGTERQKPVPWSSSCPSAARAVPCYWRRRLLLRVHVPALFIVGHRGARVQAVARGVAGPVLAAGRRVLCVGAGGVSGLETDAAKPTLLDFSIARSITKVVCGDEATFAVCDDGTLYHWGKRWEPDFERPVLEASREMTMTPTKVAGLADVVASGVHAVGLLPWEGAGLWLYRGGAHVIGQSCIRGA